MKQHRPRMSEADYQAYKMAKNTGGLSYTFQVLQLKAKNANQEMQRVKHEFTMLRIHPNKTEKENKLAPLLALASVAVGLLVGYLVWGA